MEKLKEILDQMDVPEMRKSDLGWLKRNLGIRNSGHPLFNQAMELIKELAK